LQAVLVLWRFVDRLRLPSGRSVIRQSCRRPPSTSLPLGRSQSHSPVSIQ
jgi:hypothetical protein